MHPIGYGIKSFDLSGQGAVVPAKIVTDADGLNLTAYGVLSPDKSLSLTLINKENDGSARSANVIVRPGANYVAAKMILMAAAGNDVSSKTGVTLRGAPIKDDGTWDGVWSPSLSPAGKGEFSVNVPAVTAAVIRFSIK